MSMTNRGILPGAIVATADKHTARRLLLSRYASYRRNNPHVLPVMSSPPTVAHSTTAPVALTRIYTAAADPGRFAFTGGDTLAYVGGVKFPVETEQNGGSGGNCGNGRGAIAARVKVIFDGTDIAFRLLQTTSPYGARFIVDGQYVSLTPTVATNGGYNNWITLTFASRRTREIWMETDLATAFFGCNIRPTETLMPAPAGLRMTVLGDSYTAAVASPSMNAVNDGFAQVLGDCLGAFDCRMSGAGGQGFLNAAAAGAAYKLRDRIGWDLPANSDVVVVAMGYNDIAQNQASLQAEALLALQAIRAQAPNAFVIVLGVVGAATGPSAGATTCEASILAAFLAWADPHSLHVPCSSHAGGPMLYGTGRVGATNASGNSDVYIGTDSAHPADAAAHAFIGCWFADRIAALL